MPEAGVEFTTSPSPVDTYWVALRSMASGRTKHSGGPVVNPMVNQRPSTLLVASTGGHLEELVRLRARLIPECGEVTWVTHDSEQSRSLLVDQRVHYVRYVPPRGYLSASANFLVALRVLRGGEFHRVVSTGAGIAVPFIAAARLARLPCHYIESAARTLEPSLTGRIVARIPGTRTYTQYRSWESTKWLFRGSLFDGFSTTSIQKRELKRVVVTLGTIRGYEFNRAVDRLMIVFADLLGPDAEILWQIGATSARGLPGTVCANISNAELRSAIAASDLVIAHAGIGSALTALEGGHCPVLLPRRPQYGEHVDDHQALIAQALDDRGLAISAEASEVTAEQLIRASSIRVSNYQHNAPFVLTDKPHMP